MTITAKVIADSVGADAPRLTTLQLRYPKFIHGEFMTHRAFSRNASSSRAIPVERLIKDVIDDPVYPSFWGKNQAGMQAAEECDERVTLPDCVGPTSRQGWEVTRINAWELAREQAVEMARAFAAAGYHKQIVNRLLEPFCHINVVVTSTEWSNFFALRCHPAAQPEMRELAEKMREAMDRSTPVQTLTGQWHVPYVDPHDHDWTDDDSVVTAVRLSVARCARVSYLTQEGKKPTVAEDLGLYERLVGAVPLHASPAEHQATPDRRGDFDSGRPMTDPPPGPWKQPHLHGNLRGWCQFRKTLSGEFVPG